MKDNNQSRFLKKLWLSLAAALGTALILGGCSIPVDEIDSALKQTEDVAQLVGEIVAPDFTYEDLLQANSWEAVSSRHKSWRMELYTADEMAARAFGSRSIITYCDPDFTYIESDQSNLGKDTDYTKELYTKAGNYFWYGKGSDGEETTYYCWYAMGEDEKKNYIYDNDNFHLVADGSEWGETLVSARDNGDGTVTAVTCMPAENDAFDSGIPEEWKGGTEVFQYLLDAETLEVREMGNSIVSDRGEFVYFKQPVFFDEPVPESSADLRAFAEKVEAPEPETPKTITVIYDPGTPEEETFSKTVDASCPVWLNIRSGYELYDDPEGKTPWTESDGMSDVLYYAIKN